MWNSNHGLQQITFLLVDALSGWPSDWLIHEEKKIRINRNQTEKTCQWPIDFFSTAMVDSIGVFFHEQNQLSNKFLTSHWFVYDCSHFFFRNWTKLTKGIFYFNFFPILCKVVFCVFRHISVTIIIIIRIWMNSFFLQFLIRFYFCWIFSHFFHCWLILFVSRFLNLS